MNLTEEEKERLKGFYKVAKKLEKMEYGQQDKYVFCSINYTYNFITNYFRLLTGNTAIQKTNKKLTNKTTIQVLIVCHRIIP